VDVASGYARWSQTYDSLGVMTVYSRPSRRT